MLSCWCQSEFRNLACDSRLRLTSVNLFEKGLEVYRAPTPGSSKRWQQQRFWISIDHWSLTLKKQHLPTEGANKFQIQSLLKFQLHWQALDWILDHGTQAHTNVQWKLTFANTDCNGSEAHVAESDLHAGTLKFNFGQNYCNGKKWHQSLKGT